MGFYGAIFDGVLTKRNPLPLDELPDDFPPKYITI